MSWNDVVTQERLDESWRKYSKDYQNTNPRLYSILDNHTPTLVGEKQLKILLRNKTQENELLKEKSVITGFLKRSLKNAHLTLDFEIASSDNAGPKKAFTVADKFKLMAEKNPALMDFKKEFGLDLE